jgi:aldehyde dehydrogenase (NAD(P)+)
MAHEALAMSATAVSKSESERTALDAAVRAVKAKQVEFARLPVREKIALLRPSIPLTAQHAEAWVRDGLHAKGIPETNGEEWALGPFVLLRHLKLLVQSLEQIARAGAPELGRAVRTRPDGRLAIEVMPTSVLDQILFTGIGAECWMERGLTERDVRERQASFYKRENPTGSTALVLGAGNVAFLTPGDFLTKMFNEGAVCVVKMNPVNEYVGPHLEKIFAPLIERDYLRIVYGGGEAGAFLTGHPEIDEIHMTGSERVHDLIVWGPPGPERERRKTAKDPVTRKHVTSELGAVTPLVLVPAAYSERELKWHARNAATQLASNASFMCVAAKMLVLSKGWAQKDAFLEAMRAELRKTPLRKAYYPGAQDRFDQLTHGRQTERIGTPQAGELPWTLILDVDPKKPDPLFEIEPFCSVLSIAELEESDPIEFLGAAVKFANEQLWGTLTANLIVHPRLEKDPKFAAALDQAISDLRYGTVSINQWSGVSCALGSTPWGGHQSVTLEDIQSGLGWVHNTYMLEGIEKCVFRSPFTIFPTPLWFVDNARAHEVGPKIVRLLATDSWLGLPSLFWSALRG